MPIPPEEARKYLASRRIDNWKKTRDLRAVLLHPDVGTAYRQFVDCGLGWGEAQKRQTLAYHLENLSVKNRKSFFDLIAPGMVDWMELAMEGHRFRRKVCERWGGTQASSKVCRCDARTSDTRRAREDDLW